MAAALPSFTPPPGALPPKTEADKKEVVSPAPQPSSATSAETTNTNAKILNIFKSLEATTKAVESSQKHTVTVPAKSNTNSAIATTAGLVAKSNPSGGLSLEEQRIAHVEKHFGTGKSLKLFKTLADEVLANGDAMAAKASTLQGLVARNINVVGAPPQMYLNKEGHVFVHLNSFIGAGSFKDVSRALKYDSAELVAVALLNAETLYSDSSDPETIMKKERAISSIRNEAEKLLQFKGQEGIAQIHEVIYVPDPQNPDKLVVGGLMLVLYEEGDLLELIRAEAKLKAADLKPLDKLNTFSDKASKAVTMLKGLKATHDAGIVHNDIKPDNIMRGKGTIVIADYGLASKPGKACSCGTPEYMSPEANSAFNLRGDIQETTKELPSVEHDLKNAQEKLLKNPNSPEAKAAVEELQNKLAGAKKWISEQTKKLEEMSKELGFPKDTWAMGITLYEYFFPKSPLPIDKTPENWRQIFLDNLKTSYDTPEPDKSIKDTLRKMVEWDPAKRISSADAVKAFEKIDEMVKNLITKEKAKERAKRFRGEYS